jgi:hypothetical protein
MESEKVKEIKSLLEIFANDNEPDGTTRICREALVLINELESENETLRNAKVVYETVDYCYEDLKKAEKRIAELEGEITKLDIINSKLEMDIELLNKQNIDLEIDRDYYQEQFNEQEDFYVEWNKQQLKQFAERLKENFYYEGRICRYIIDSDVFDETLKEFIK